MSFYDLIQVVIENIKRIRKEKHISQEKLAEYCGTSASYIGLMETYKNIPKLSTIERIAEALNVPVLDLFASEANKSAEGANENDNSENLTRESERKQKIRSHIKNEIIAKLSMNLDDILQMI